jgi:hypothetical protein
MLPGTAAGPGPAPANPPSLPRVVTGGRIGDQVTPGNSSSYMYTRYGLLRTVTDV